MRGLGVPEAAAGTMAMEVSADLVESRAMAETAALLGQERGAASISKAEA
jgi:hypothetical protein